VLYSSISRLFLNAFLLQLQCSKIINTGAFKALRDKIKRPGRIYLSQIIPGT
jgi:hypothetical protein